MFEPQGSAGTRKPTLTLANVLAPLEKLADPNGLTLGVVNQAGTDVIRSPALKAQPRQFNRASSDGTLPRRNLERPRSPGF